MITALDMTLEVDWHGSKLAGLVRQREDIRLPSYWRGGSLDAQRASGEGSQMVHARALPSMDPGRWYLCRSAGFPGRQQRPRFGGHWFRPWLRRQIEFVAFDFPGMQATWDKRIREAARALKGSVASRAGNFFQIATDCKSYSQLTGFLQKLRPLGGEGACMRNPETTTYETGRSENLLRFKFHR